MRWENQRVNYHYKIGFVCEISKGMSPVYIIVHSQDKKPSVDFFSEFLCKLEIVAH